MHVISHGSTWIYCIARLIWNLTKNVFSVTALIALLNATVHNTSLGAKHSDSSRPRTSKLREFGMPTAVKSKRYHIWHVFMIVEKQKTLIGSRVSKKRPLHVFGLPVSLNQQQLRERGCFLAKDKRMIHEEDDRRYGFLLEDETSTSNAYRVRMWAPWSGPTVQPIGRFCFGRYRNGWTDGLNCNTRASAQHKTHSKQQVSKRIGTHTSNDLKIRGHDTKSAGLRLIWCQKAMLALYRTWLIKGKKTEIFPKLVQFPYAGQQWPANLKSMLI